MELSIFKSIIWSHLDYGNIIYDEADNASCKKKLESIQRNAKCCSFV